jgi:hypothetical protein
MARDGRCRTSSAAVVERTERQFDGDADPSSMQSPSFAVSEFGRLICILLQVTSVQQDLLQSGINLIRVQTDRREGRDSFWALSVECAFNDPGVRVSLATAGHLADIDVKAAPRAHRPGNQLKSAFFKARGVFTTAHMRWSLSGQMDPEKFIDFLPTAPRSTDISAEGMRAHILFIALRCGTPEERIPMP